MKDLSRSWSYPVVLNTGPLDWESSNLTTAEHPIFIVVLHKTNIESDIFADRNMRPRCIVDAQMTSNLKSFASNIKRI